MLDKFIENLIYIKVKKEDLPLMKDLAKALNCKFASGETLYGNRMQNYLEEYGTIFLYHYLDTKVRYTVNYQYNSVTVTEFLNNKQYTIDENELISLVTENV